MSITTNERKEFFRKGTPVLKTLMKTCLATNWVSFDGRRVTGDEVSLFLLNFNPSLPRSISLALKLH